MSMKRNKKIIDTSYANNSKKSKYAVNAESQDVQNNVKKKKEENTANLLNDNKIVVGNKRKLHDTDVIPKKTKKGKLNFNANSVENVEDFSSVPSAEFNNHKVLEKGKKKNKIIFNEESRVSQNSATDLSKSSVQKTSKKRKSKKDKSSNDHINSSLKDDIIPLEEAISTIYDKSNVQENINLKTKHCTENGSINYPNSKLHANVGIAQEGNKAENSDVTVKKGKEVIRWPEEDLKKLVDRMEACIPEHDTLAFGTRAEKLEWDTIAFKDYSVEECKKTWFLLQKQIRKFRLLKEVLADAKEWISTPKVKKKNWRHPDMPRKPLTAYFIYYMQKKDALHKLHPGLDAAEISKMLGQKFKNLTPEKRLKYENLALKQKNEYQEKLEEFYQSHPEVPRAVKVTKQKAIKEKKQKPIKERVPKRPPPPFHYYYLAELEKQEHIEDALAFKEICKERWKQLPDEKKVVWINNAEVEYGKYEDALTKYQENHPDQIHSPQKPILTKEELQIKERVAGKPTKPPGSAYNLFARMLLQSDEIKNVPFRDRLNFVSNQWKNCPEEEKKQYRELFIKLNDKYKADYALYLESLSEEERKLELQKAFPKRRKSEGTETEKKVKSKKKAEKKTSVRKIVEPEQPPISPFKYFSSLYNGEEPVMQAWKALTTEQKKVYEDELVRKKQAYIVNFEKFLKSLSKEELEAFSNSRNKTKKQSEDEEVTATSDESATDDSSAETNEQDDD